MGILGKMKKKITKKDQSRVENILLLSMQQHIKSYPHAYFIRKAPKHFTYKGR